jgi:hypothetical protein
MICYWNIPLVIYNGNLSQYHFDFKSELELENVIN